jgi:hypothetical protein
MKSYLFFFIAILLISPSALVFADTHPANLKQRIDNTTLSASDNFKLSPYTGYTRAHWLEINEKLIAGAMPYFNVETGVPEIPLFPKASAFEKIYQKEDRFPDLPRRVLERLLMTVVVYTKATGNDTVPGYKGSITAPFIKAIIRGCDPNSVGYWKDQTKSSNTAGSVLAMAVYINPTRFWDPFTPQQKRNLLEFIKAHAYNPSNNNNWYYFHLACVPLLEQNGLPSNRELLTKQYEHLMGWYRGDGWFMDGSNRSFDYYNFWAFQMYNGILYRYDCKWREQFGERIKTTTAAFLKTLPYLYGKDGGQIPWGRSLTYRFASNAALSWAVINGYSTLPPGEARRIISGSMKYFWDHHCLGENGLLNIGYWGDNSSVAEPYTAPGDTYWAAQGLACLLIPENDPFWTATEAPIPADGKGGKLAVEGAQFSLCVSSIDGDARMFPVGQPLSWNRDIWQAGEKYDQHAYSSSLGFCVTGEGTGDIGAGRTGYSYNGQKWYYRERAKPILIETNHLVSIYTLKPKDEKSTIIDNNRDEMITHTLVGNDGEIHLFWHNYPDSMYLHLGGYGIAVPLNQRNVDNHFENGLLVKSSTYYSLMKALYSPKGEFTSELLEPKEGWTYSHLFDALGAFPKWRSAQLVAPFTPIVIYVNGTKNRVPETPKIELKYANGLMKIMFEGKSFTVKIR